MTKFFNGLAYCYFALAVDGAFTHWIPREMPTPPIHVAILVFLGLGCLAYATIKEV